MGLGRLRRTRATGVPTSGNGASSFHLIWDTKVGFSSVSAVLEVVDPPKVDSLYFWALQVGFADATRRFGGGHIGLQWNPRHSRSTAANWGGYDPAGLVLDGTDSTLSGFSDDPHTRDYPWEPGKAYRLSVARSTDRRGSWRGTVVDGDTGEQTHVRDLHGGGDRLLGPMVWSEVFAACDAPGVAVRWSSLSARTVDGEHAQPDLLRVNYQSFQAGGCSNTDVEVVGGGVIQRTSVARSLRQGALVELV